MIDIHPTATGGNGKRLPERRSKPGDPEKHIIKCFQCGYSFVEDRDQEGESTSDGGNTYESIAVAINNTQSKLPVHLRGMTTFAATSKTVVDPVVTSGCPLCGTYNPRGDGAEKDFFRTVDLSNQQHLPSSILQLVPYIKITIGGYK